MKPREFQRVLETDDGIFNIEWWEYKKLPKLQCEHKTAGGGGLRCTKVGKFWCVECGLVVCLKHRAGHNDKPVHHRRIIKLGGKHHRIRVKEVD